MSAYRQGVPAADADVRALLRRERGSVDMELTLQRRERDVLLTVPKIAWEDYQEVPDTATVLYVPAEHALVVELPEPAVETTLADFE